MPLTPEQQQRATELLRQGMSPDQVLAAINQPAQQSASPAPMKPTTAPTQTESASPLSAQAQAVKKLMDGGMSKDDALNQVVNQGQTDQPNTTIKVGQGENQDAVQRTAQKAADSGIPGVATAGRVVQSTYSTAKHGVENAAGALLQGAEAAVGKDLYGDGKGTELTPEERATRGTDAIQRTGIALAAAIGTPAAGFISAIPFGVGEKAFGILDEWALNPLSEGLVYGAQYTSEYLVNSFVTGQWDNFFNSPETSRVTKNLMQTPEVKRSVESLKNIIPLKFGKGKVSVEALNGSGVLARLNQKFFEGKPLSKIPSQAEISKVSDAASGAMDSFINRRGVVQKAKDTLAYAWGGMDATIQRVSELAQEVRNEKKVLVEKYQDEMGGMSHNVDGPNNSEIQPMFEKAFNDAWQKADISKDEAKAISTEVFNRIHDKLSTKPDTTTGGGGSAEGAPAVSSDSYFAQFSDIERVRKFLGNETYGLAEASTKIPGSRGFNQYMNSLTSPKAKFELALKEQIYNKLREKQNEIGSRLSRFSETGKTYADLTTEESRLINAEKYLAKNKNTREESFMRHWGNIWLRGATSAIAAGGVAYLTNPIAAAAILSVGLASTPIWRGVAFGTTTGFKTGAKFVNGLVAEAKSRFPNAVDRNVFIKKQINELKKRGGMVGALLQAAEDNGIEPEAMPGVMMQAAETAEQSFSAAEKQIKAMSPEELAKAEADVNTLPTEADVKKLHSVGTTVDLSASDREFQIKKAMGGLSELSRKDFVSEVYNAFAMFKREKGNSRPPSAVEYNRSIQKIVGDTDVYQSIVEGNVKSPTIVDPKLIIAKLNIDNGRDVTANIEAIKEIVNDGDYNELTSWYGEKLLEKYGDQYAAASTDRAVPSEVTDAVTREQDSAMKQTAKEAATTIQPDQSIGMEVYKLTKREDPMQARSRLEEMAGKGSARAEELLAQLRNADSAWEDGFRSAMEADKLTVGKTKAKK